MKYIGTITAESDPPGLSRSRWLGAIREHPRLSLPESREGINPFTKQPMMIRPRHDASVIVDGHEVGRMTWAPVGANEVHVFGEPEIVGPIATAVAAMIDGRFDPNASRDRSIYGRLLEPIWH